jgi:hypothetical protein
MNRLQLISVAVTASCGAAVYAGPVVDLAPGDFTPELSGIMNTQMSELIGATESDTTYDFSIFSSPNGASAGDGPALLYEASLQTRIVRSNETGNLHFNYRITDPNVELLGQVSHIEISGFAGLQTRIEYRNELTAPGDEGPIAAARSIDGDLLSFDFGEILDTHEESKYFFAMLDIDTFGQAEEGLGNVAVATIYLHSGDTVSIDIPGPVPTPSALSLLSIAGIITARRRR